MPHRTIMLRVADHSDDWAVSHLFGELHTLNAGLDERFALAEGWEQVLGEHLAHVRETGRGMTTVAWLDTDPVGLVMMGVHSDSRLFKHRYWSELLALYVAPQMRGTALATRLLETGCYWAHTHGYERVQLYVTAVNERARRFYERVGFRRVQEIWRAELGLAEGLPPEDPAAEAAFAHCEELLSTGSHHLLIDYDEPEI